MITDSIKFAIISYQLFIKFPFAHVLLNVLLMSTFLYSSSIHSNKFVMAKDYLEKVDIVQTLDFHNSDITSCAFDENFRIASGSSDKSVAVWEWKPGDGYVQVPYSPIQEYQYAVNDVKFISSYGILVTASLDGVASLWNIYNGSLLHTFTQANLVGVRRICYLDTFQYLVCAGDDGILCIWDFIRKTQISLISAHEESVSVIAASSDNKIIISGDTTGVAKLWNPSKFTDRKCNPMHVIADCHDLGINGADFARDTTITDAGIVYKLATCGNDDNVKLWNVTLRKSSKGFYRCHVAIILILDGHSSAVTCVKFNPEANLVASTSIDKTIRLWDVETTYKCIKVLQGHTRYVTCCSFSPDGSLLATGSNDKALIVWDLTGNINLESNLNKLDCTDKPRYSYVNSNFMKETEQIQIWQKIDNIGYAINSCCFSKQNLLAAGGTEKVVRLWYNDVHNKLVELSVSPLEGHRYSINQVDFSMCGTMLASCSVDGTAIIWDVTTYRIKGILHSSGGGVIKSCRFSPDCNLLATANDTEVVSLWSVYNLQLIVDLLGHTDAVLCVSFSHDSKYLVSGCTGGHMRLWSSSPAISICLLLIENSHDLGVTSVDFAPDGKYLLASCGNDSLISLWNIEVLSEIKAKAKLKLKLQGHGGDITCVRFPHSTSDILSSTATDKTARIWDTVNGVCLHVLDSKDSMLTSCSFSSDGSLLATGTFDKSVIIWRVRTAGDFDNLAFDKLTLSNQEECATASSGTSDVRELLVMLNEQQDVTKVDIPHEFLCPITHQIMINPVTSSDGYNYEKSAIEAWHSAGGITSPMTNEILADTSLISNERLKNEIHKYLNY